MRNDAFSVYLLQILFFWFLDSSAIFLKCFELNWKYDWWQTRVLRLLALVSVFPATRDSHYHPEEYQRVRSMCPCGMSCRSQIIYLIQKCRVKRNSSFFNPPLIDYIWLSIFVSVLFPRLVKVSLGAFPLSSSFSSWT